MVDAVTSPSPTPETPPTAATQPVPAAAPVTASPAPAPIAPAAQPPAAEPAPVVATTPAPAPAAATDKPVEPSSPAAAEPAAAVPTLLEKFDKEKADAEAAKAAKAAAPKPQATEAAKPAEAPPAQPTAPVPTPVEYKYTLPETIRMDDTLKGEVHGALDAFRANPSEGVQGLINLHEKQMRAFAEHMANEQQRIFRETRQGWAKEILSDPEIGGSGHQTAMGAIARMRDLFVPEKDRPRFEEFLRVTGAGDHPSFLKLLHQAARFYDEPALPPPNPRPAPGNGRRPTNRLRDIYDHPRSTSEGRS
jgi:hypothetical protein